MNQSNCSGKGHSGFWTYGYDFTMPIGTIVTAAREGQVILAESGCEDGDGSCTNQVAIEHSDGDVTVYTHLTKGGATVEAGARVQAGDAIAKSGNTGYTGRVPAPALLPTPLPGHLDGARHLRLDPTHVLEHRSEPRRADSEAYVRRALSGRSP